MTVTPKPSDPNRTPDTTRLGSLWWWTFRAAAVAVLAAMFVFGPDRISRMLVPSHYAPAEEDVGPRLAPDAVVQIRSHLDEPLGRLSPSDTEQARVRDEIVRVRKLLDGPRIPSVPRVRGALLQCQAAVSDTAPDARAVRKAITRCLTIVDLADPETRRMRRAIDTALGPLTREVVRRRLQDFTNMPAGSPLKSRVTGYPGCRETARYIERVMRDELGLERVTVDPYDVTVPVDLGGSLSWQESGTTQRVPIHCLWPNHVRTPTLPRDGIDAILIDGGDGGLGALNKRGPDDPDPSECAVLVRFGCRQAYMNAASLGARAILFYADPAGASPDGREHVTREQAHEKFFDVPVNVPRFWVEPGDAKRLVGLARSRRHRVHLAASMEWRRVRSRNIYGWLPGLDQPIPDSLETPPRRWKGRLIVLQASYDSISVVPAIAPGAENAGGIVALIEVVRALKRFGPRYSVLVLATSGHFQALAGITDFVRRHCREDAYFRDRIPDSQKIDFDLLVNLDLSSHGRQVAAICEGLFTNPNWQQDDYRRKALSPFAERFVTYTQELFPPPRVTQTQWPGENSRFLDAIAPKKRPWWSYLGAPAATDSQIVTKVGKYGMSLITAHDPRRRVDTPYDTLQQADVDALTHQVRTTAAVLLRAHRDPAFFPDTKLALTDRMVAQRGVIVQFDRDVNFFAPKALMGGSLVTCRPGNWRYTDRRNCAGVRTRIVQKTPEGNPRGGDASRGYRIEAMTTDSRLLRVSAWDRSARTGEAHVVLATRAGVFRYPLARRARPDGTTWSAVVRVDRRHRGWVSLVVVVGVFVLGAAVCVVVARRGVGLSPGVRRALRVGGAVAIAVGAAWAGYVLWLQGDPPIAVPCPEDVADGPVVREIAVGGHVLNIDRATGRAKPVLVAHGQFKGQFVFPIRWTNEFTAYKLDRDGRIAYAPDRGQEGAETYPITSNSPGAKELNMIEVLFRCRALSLFETADSQYLIALDHLVPMGEDNAQPQWFGFDFVKKQSAQDGTTTDVAVVYAKPDANVKALMSTGLVGIKYLLTGAPDELVSDPLKDAGESGSGQPITQAAEEQALGAGYPVSQSVVARPRYSVARDMWVIDDVRLKRLRQYSIRNERLWDLHAKAHRSLLEARQQFSRGQYDRAVAEARKAWALEARAYPEVKATANDTVRGVVFYLLLLVPFSFFMERLLMGFADIRRQVLGFAVMFALAFLVLHLVHPAFKLGSSPYIILLAFVIFALGGIVLVVVMRKFGQEMQKIRTGQSGRREVDIGRVSATMAALMLGVSNLRKRKMRTTLTAVTLVLLTFAALSFTSVKTYLEVYRLPRPYGASYAGVLVRDRKWRALQSSVVPHVRSAFEDKARLVARAWLLGQAKGDKAYVKVSEPRSGRFLVADAVLGLEPDEVRITRPDRFLLPGGRWFRKGERDVCILSDHQAKLLGIAPDQVGSARVRLFGADYHVVGICEADRFKALHDLDGEPLAPIDPGKSAPLQGQRDPALEALQPLKEFPHLEPNNMLILPYATVVDLGGTTHSVAIGQFARRHYLPQVREFMERIGLSVFVSEGDEVYVYSSVGRTSVTNLTALIVPMLLVGMIVLNTMLGSVYERTREIAIFSSVGLAPSHVAAVFLAEAAVFATVGAVLGYLLGQVAAFVLDRFGLGAGMYMNYSALSTVTSTLLVMGVVFLSALYPARKAAALSVPDATRKFELPEPEGDRWVFEFPFTLGANEALGLYAYLAQVFDSYSEGSMGGFIAEDVHLAQAGTPEAPEYAIAMRTWLAPYDLGVSQGVHLRAFPGEQPELYEIEVSLTRLSGDVATWKRLNRQFVTLLRKQFLVWRTVPVRDKDHYAERGRRVLAGEEL